MVESGRTRWFAAWVAWCCLVLMSLIATAAQKRCPVCHEVFDSSVEVCPNDGTDLKLLGEELADPSDSDSEVVQSGEVETKNAGPPKQEDTADSNADDADAAPSKHKYIRQDRGGRRKRAVDADATSADERTDRLRRLQDKRAGAGTVKKRVVLPGEEREKDDELREKYRKLRDQMLANAPTYTDTVIVMDPDLARQKSLWEQAAPFMSAGVKISWMAEGGNSGPVTGAEIDLNLLRTNIRVGLSSFIGIRHVGRDELIFLESVSIGVQRPWRFAPYLVGRFGIGALVSQRFGEDTTNLVRGIGFETGVDCRISDGLVVTPAVGYVRYGIREAVWDSVTLKLSVGF